MSELRTRILESKTLKNMREGISQDLESLFDEIGNKAISLFKESEDTDDVERLEEISKELEGLSNTLDEYRFDVSGSDKHVCTWWYSKICQYRDDVNTRKESLSRMEESTSKSKLHEDEKEDDDRAYKEYLKKMKANSTYKKVESLCTKYGYRLGDAIAPTRSNGKKHIEVRIVGDRNTYHADIFFNHTRFGEVKDTFEIQTLAVGSLELDEYAKYLKGCQDSYDLVGALNKIDFNTLYDPTVDYPNWND